MVLKYVAAAIAAVATSSHVAPGDSRLTIDLACSTVSGAGRFCLWNLFNKLPLVLENRPNYWVMAKSSHPPELGVHLDKGRLSYGSD